MAAKWHSERPPLNRKSLALKGKDSLSFEVTMMPFPLMVTLVLPLLSHFFHLRASA